MNPELSKKTENKNGNKGPNPVQEAVDHVSKYETSMQCGHCTLKGATRMCGRCKKVSYCDQECQKKDWASHKKVCQ